MPEAGPLLPAWDSLLDGLRTLAVDMLDRLPPRLRDDPQAQHEVGRLMLSALAVRSLDAIAADPNRPMFLPALNVVLNVFQPNADTVYRQATVAAGGSYRLRGRKGSLRIAKIGMYGVPASGGNITAVGFHDINTLTGLDDDGTFDVLLSLTKPEGYTGDWWKLEPNVYMLSLRQVAYDWATERDPIVSIERVDVPAPRPRPSAADLEKRLGGLVEATRRTSTLLIDHVEELRADGYINKFKEWDVVGGFGGLFGQFYYEGAYELADDEALIIETEYPDEVDYASLILTNDIFETTDWYNNHSSLNGSQWRRDTDGKLRVVVSAKDPGVHNWLDTSGYPTGVIQGRWTDSSSTPMPTAVKVKLAEVDKLLPSDTARVSLDERDQIIRDRRANFQQRVLW